MKKITDERLIMRNLKNVRLAFVVQTLGILAILFYELLQGGIDQMRDNPLWLVFMITMVVFAYSSMNISVDSERNANNPKNSFLISTAVVFVIALAVCILTANTPGFDLANGALIGGIIFVCGLVPCYYIYRLRKRREDEFEDE